MSPRPPRPPATPEETEAKLERRRRSLRVSTFCLHALTWILATFYATDYLPALFVRATVGVNQAALPQYLAGYLLLGVICLVLAIAFGCYYGPHIKASRYSWRWYVFPVALALLLIPAQGSNELLTRAVEAACLIPGIALGGALSQPWRRRRRPARDRVAAP
ncbi:MAG: hypothetical protein ACRENX_10115 [Candidatus Dormibacteria bacterium]